MEKAVMKLKQKIPFALALFAMISGVSISILFGVNESLFKDKISKDIQLNEKIMSIVDQQKRETKIEQEESKNWRYYQRFHFHSTGISAMTLGVLVLLTFSLAPSLIKLTTSYMISVGGFLYPFVWLFAALYGPIMGRAEAKEAFAVFGYMGGVFLVGLVLALIVFIRYPVKRLNNAQD
jgi:hypothetical protein